VTSTHLTSSNSFWPQGKTAWVRVVLTLAAIGMAVSFLIWSPYPYLARARAAGTLAPDFRAVTTDGQVFQLSALRGRPVLLNFFSTDCPWSQAAVENINAMLESRPDVVVLSVNANHASVAEVLAFSEKTRPNYPLLLDPFSLITSRYRPFRTPFWFFINAEGLITAVRFGEHHGYNLVYRVNEFLPLPVVLGE
jgi:hypothetical protein